MTAFGLHWGLTGTEFAYNAGALRDAVSIPGSGRSPGGGNDRTHQYSCQDNPMNRGACGLYSMGSQSWTRLSTHVYDYFFPLSLQESWFSGLTWYFKLLDTSPSLWFPFSSVAQSFPTLCDPMNRSTPGLPIHHHFPEFTQTHIHRVSDAIQPSHPLSSPFPPAPSPSQHQSLFQWVNSSHEVAKVLEFQL